MIIELLCDEVTHLATMDADILMPTSVKRSLPASIAVTDDDSLENIKGKKAIRPSSDDDYRK